MDASIFATSDFLNSFFQTMPRIKISVNDTVSTWPVDVATCKGGGLKKQCPNGHWVTATVMKCPNCGHQF